MLTNPTEWFLFSAITIIAKYLLVYEFMSSSKWCLPITSYLRLNPLGSNGYTKIYHAAKVFGEFGGLIGFLKTHEGALGTPSQYLLLCM